MFWIFCEVSGLDRILRAMVEFDEQRFSTFLTSPFCIAPIRGSNSIALTITATGKLTEGCLLPLFGRIIEYGGEACSFQLVRNILLRELQKCGIHIDKLD